VSICVLIREKGLMGAHFPHLPEGKCSTNSRKRLHLSKRFTGKQLNARTLDGLICQVFIVGACVTQVHALCGYGINKVDKLNVRKVECVDIKL
jgi:hypothetical protein